MNADKNARLALSKAQMVEWQVCEDEREWQVAQTQSHESPGVEVQRHWGQRELVRWGVPSLLVVLVLALAGGWWLWDRAQRGLDQIETELEGAVVADLWSAGPTRASTNATFQESSVLNAVRLHGDAGEIIRQLEILDLGRDWAVIEVVVQPAADGPAYRQTRVYRYGDGGWIREEATAKRWGAARQLETDSFVFHYYALDEEAVTQAATRLDALYLTLYVAFYEHAPAAEKLAIHVNPERRPEAVPYQSQAQQVEPGSLFVASPSAMLAPAESTPGDVLLQSLVLSLASRFTKEAATRHSLPPRGSDMHSALILWLIWEQELPLAVWRKPLVEWVFGNSQGSDGQESLAIPEFAHDLCGHHRLWAPSPLDVAVPVHCWVSDGGEERIVAWRFPSASLEIPLAPLVYRSEEMNNLSLWHYVPQPEPAVRAVALATVLEYVATTYGAERVPLLVAALPEHERAETLIPAVLGLSLEAFQSGWREFLREEYDLAP